MTSRPADQRASGPTLSESQYEDLLPWLADWEKKLTKKKKTLQSHYGNVQFDSVTKTFICWE